MFHTRKNAKKELEFVSIEDLIPQDHLLRKIDQYIDFSFILEKVRPYYSEDDVSPSLDPLVVFKMMFIGFFYGVRSERLLEKEIQMNIAYRWFLGLRLQDPVPHHSTISWNRRKRFNEFDIFQENYDEIVLLTMSQKMVGGRVLFIDSLAFGKIIKNRCGYIERTFADSKQPMGFATAG